MEMFQYCHQGLRTSRFFPPLRSGVLGVGEKVRQKGVSIDCALTRQSWDGRGWICVFVRYDGSEQCSSCSIVLIILLKETPVREKRWKRCNEQNCGDFKGWKMRRRRYSSCGLPASPNNPLARSRVISIGWNRLGCWWPTI